MNHPFQAMYRRLVELHSQPRSREELEAVYTRVWDEQELLQAFDVLGLTDAGVDVRRKADGAVGSLSLQESPRLYFCWIGVL